MLALVPFLLFALVILASLIRGRAVRARSGVNAFAFVDARGIQRAAGAAFALSIALLVGATLLLALGRLEATGACLTIGSAIVAAGAWLVITAQVQMGNAWRVGVREGDAPLFVTTGLFRFSRNPIFVGMIAMALGAALVVGTWWAWTSAMVFALACHVQVRIEEAHLARQFGAEYDAFRRSVPRWLFF